MTQIRDGKEPYTYVSSRPGPEGRIARHIHGSGGDAIEHEHSLGEGIHRHEEPRETLILNPTGRP